MRRKGDENLFVRFYNGAVQSGAQSDAAGHPVFVEKAFVEILVPGDPHNIVDTQVTQYYIDRFPDEWDRFNRSQGQAIEGWLLREWPVVNPAQVKNLEFLNVRTVEQLAGLTDTQCQKIGMGAADLRAKAQAAVAAAKDGAATTAQAAENKRLSDELEALRAQIAAMGATEKRGPGRPARVTAEA